MVLINKKKKDNKNGHGQQSCIRQQSQERRPPVIMAWGHRPRFRTINRYQRRHKRKKTGASHSLRSACCDSSWQNRQQGEGKQKNKKRTQPQNKERKVALGGVKPLQSASRGGPVATSLPHMAPVFVWLQLSVSTPHPAGNRSCCHISAPHGSCPPSGHSCQYLD